MNLSLAVLLSANCKDFAVRANKQYLVQIQRSGPTLGAVRPIILQTTTPHPACKHPKVSGIISHSTEDRSSLHILRS